MQNREVPLGSLPIFFSSLRLAEAGRTCPEVRGGETGRGTRATVRGTQKTEPRARARARGAGRGRRGHGRRGHGRRVRGRGCGTRKTRAWGAGRKTRNTWTRTRTRARARGHGGTGARGAGRRTQDAGRRTQNAERRTQNTGYWPRAAEHGKWGHEVQKTEDAGTGCRTQNTGYWPRAAEHGKRGHGAQETGHRRRGTSPRAWNATRQHTPRQAPQQPAWTVHSRAPSAAGTNPPGPFTAGRPPPGPATTRRGHSQPGAIRHRDLQQPAGAVHSRAPSAAGRRYLSRVRIRITPLPPRTPYMLLPRCTSTDLTS